MKVQGCDLRRTEPTIPMVDTETGEFAEKAICADNAKKLLMVSGLLPIHDRSLRPISDQVIVRLSRHNQSP
jgi:hypothetical protein